MKKLILALLLFLTLSVGFSDAISDFVKNNLNFVVAAFVFVLIFGISMGVAGIWVEDPALISVISLGVSMLISVLILINPNVSAMISSIIQYSPIFLIAFIVIVLILTVLLAKKPWIRWLAGAILLAALIALIYLNGWVDLSGVGSSSGYNPTWPIVILILIALIAVIIYLVVKAKRNSSAISTTSAALGTGPAAVPPSASISGPAPSIPLIPRDVEITGKFLDGLVGTKITKSLNMGLRFEISGVSHKFTFLSGLNKSKYTVTQKPSTIECTATFKNGDFKFIIKHVTGDLIGCLVVLNDGHPYKSPQFTILNSVKLYPIDVIKTPLKKVKVIVVKYNSSSKKYEIVKKDDDVKLHQGSTETPYNLDIDKKNYELELDNTTAINITPAKAKDYQFMIKSGSTEAECLIYPPQIHFNHNFDGTERPFAISDPLLSKVIPVPITLPSISLNSTLSDLQKFNMIVLIKTTTSSSPSPAAASTSGTAPTSSVKKFVKIIVVKPAVSGKADEYDVIGTSSNVRYIPMTSALPEDYDVTSNNYFEIGNDVNIMLSDKNYDFLIIGSDKVNSCKFGTYDFNYDLNGNEKDVKLTFINSVTANSHILKNSDSNLKNFNFVVLKKKTIIPPSIIKTPEDKDVENPEEEPIIEPIDIDKKKDETKDKEAAKDNKKLVVDLTFKPQGTPQPEKGTFKMMGKEYNYAFVTTEMSKGNEIKLPFQTSAENFKTKATDKLLYLFSVDKIITKGNKLDYEPLSKDDLKNLIKLTGAFTEQAKTDQGKNDFLADEFMFYIDENILANQNYKISNKLKGVLPQLVKSGKTCGINFKFTKDNVFDKKDIAGFVLTLHSTLVTRININKRNLAEFKIIDNIHAAASYFVLKTDADLNDIKENIREELNMVTESNAQPAEKMKNISKVSNHLMKLKNVIKKEIDLFELKDKDLLDILKENIYSGNEYFFEDFKNHCDKLKNKEYEFLDKIKINLNNKEMSFKTAEYELTVALSENIKPRSLNVLFKKIKEPKKSFGFNVNENNEKSLGPLERNLAFLVICFYDNLKGYLIKNKEKITPDSDKNKPEKEIDWLPNEYYGDINVNGFWNCDLKNYNLKPYNDWSELINKIKEFLKDKIDKQFNFKDLCEKINDSISDNSTANEKYVIVGDTHGEPDKTLTVLKKYWDEGYNFIFLGDYVDRGYSSIVNLGLLLTLQFYNPERIILLRGNHETKEVNGLYGLMTELVFFKKENKSLNRTESEKLFDLINEVFDKMPSYSILYNKYFLVHGGVPELDKDVGKNYDFANKQEELWWNDPDSEQNVNWSKSGRGAGKIFNEKGLDDSFAKMKPLLPEDNEFKMLIRAHQPVNKTKTYFKGFNGKVLSIFNASYGANKYGIVFLAVSDPENTKLQALTIASDGKITDAILVKFYQKTEKGEYVMVETVDIVGLIDKVLTETKRKTKMVKGSSSSKDNKNAPISPVKDAVSDLLPTAPKKEGSNKIPPKEPDKSLKLTPDFDAANYKGYIKGISFQIKPDSVSKFIKKGDTTSKMNKIELSYNNVLKQILENPNLEKLKEKYKHVIGSIIVCTADKKTEKDLLKEDNLTELLNVLSNLKSQTGNSTDLFG